MANNRTVILNLFQDFSVKMAPVDLARWMLKHVQRDTIEVMV